MGSDSSSTDDHDKKSIGATLTTPIDLDSGEVGLDSDHGYTRYLELHQKSDGPARAKLIRKSKSRLYSAKNAPFKLMFL